MTEDRRDPMLEKVRKAYNAPGAVPREAMWSAIEGRLGERGRADVVDLDAARARRGDGTGRRDDPRGVASWGSGRSMGWAVAAAAVLVLGIGIGRMTAPGGPEASVAEATAAGASAASVALAAREHLGRTESLLTMVRADARAGRVDPATAGWASGLLSETRLLLDAEGAVDPAVEELLLDLELVLIQIVGVAETGSEDEGRARTELELALRTLEDGEVLPRIQAVLPAGMEGV